MFFNCRKLTKVLIPYVGVLKTVGSFFMAEGGEGRGLNYFGHTFLYSYTRSTFFIFAHRFFFLISDFLAKSLRANKNQRKRSLILQYSFALKTLQTFQQTCSCLLSEKTFALHHFWTPKNAFLKHFQSKCLYISVQICKKNFAPQTYFCLQTYLDTSIYSIKTLEFSKQHGLQG